jgi:hypothetical protein
MNAARYVVAALALSVLVGGGDATASSGGATKGGRDRQSPSIVVSSIQQTPTAIVVSGTAADNVGVAKVDVSVDGGVFATAQGTTTWSYAIGAGRLGVGNHTLTARVVDPSGNRALASATFAVATTTDSSPPTASFTAPSPDATLSGTATITGTAGDDAQLAKVELSVDGRPYQAAQGTSSWAVSLDTSTYANGPHTLKARATDASGNVGTATETVAVSNDLAPPSVTIASPTQSATVSGTASVTGTAADDVSVASVAISFDGGAYQAVQGTTSWTYALDTTRLANGSHTLAARAIDGAGKTTSIALTVNVSNPIASSTDQTLVTPEGVTITVAPDVAGWTPQQVYDLLKPNAYELALLGSGLTIKVQTVYASQTSTGVSESGGVYSNFRATIYLRADGTSGFDYRPDQVLAHEYGHAWTLYSLYIRHKGDWTPYLQARGLLGDTRLDSTYVWDKAEMIADDYRMLFGTSTAQNQLGYINSAVADPRTVPGLQDFFVTSWGAPK